MTRRLRLPLSLLATAAVALGLSACGGSDEKDTGTAAAATTAASGHDSATVRIALTGYFDPLALGKADGSIEKAVEATGAKVTFSAPLGAFAPVAQALNAGALDIGVGSITSGIGGLVGKPGFKVFAFQSANQVDEGILVPKDSKIRTAKDLAGHTVAINKGGTGEYLLRKALDENGVSIDKVKLQYLPPPQAAPAFATGKLDAWATWGNFSGTARAKYGARFIATGGQLKSQNDVILVVANRFLDQHPALVRTVFDAARAESEKVRKDPAAATALGNQTAKLDPEVAALQTASYETQPLVEPVGKADVARFQGVADFFQEAGVIPTRPDIAKSVVDVRTLPAATR